MSNPKLIALLTAGFLTLSVALAQADPHHDQNQTPSSPKTLPTVQAPSTNPQGMPTGMMSGPGQGMTMMQMMQMMGQGGMGMMGQGLMMLEGAPFEQAFLSMMIPHHRAAVEMARGILNQTQDPQIRTWANNIIQTQEREISQMRQLLGALGGTNLAAQRMMTQRMGSDSMGMGSPGMGSSMPGMQSSTASPDKTFLISMIGHHALAIEMATMALQKAQNPLIVKLAADIASTQAQEIYRMRLKLASLK
ncbi:DUF305 domain-containing protein [Meiothermus granaticius]|uniref:DUF305 domain-containing protein n=1 Tax=Meiothermus granaticius NBRC 107808 TaxID=1227551 RepID=A0A399FDK1_9DEIN|nr:DUF305 domain-containing protein [Meiothermus granaticius]MCL6526383.1 DUF305 domain-containing protein [Thermaceae bacterium]RIH93519.1 hypothetical protein Mgrana_00573 [Meiothermus granaticius NBRC 107808]GEM86015.1 hypothetical protein MGR01S_06400 [Meiothermus granaticius NBRC 107808]